MNGLGDSQGGDNLAAEHDGESDQVRTRSLLQMSTYPFPEGSGGHVRSASDHFLMGGVEGDRTGLPLTDGHRHGPMGGTELLPFLIKPVQLLRRLIMVSLDLTRSVGRRDAFLDPFPVKVQHIDRVPGALASALEVGGAGHRTAEVLEERRDEEERRGLRPGVAFDRQRGAVGCEVDRCVNHDVTIFPWRHPVCNPPTGSPSPDRSES